MGRATQQTRAMVAAALVAALMAVSAWIVVPLGPVPITLQIFVVVLAALFLEPVWAFAAMAVYLLLGAFGLPVFSLGRAGLGVLVGPTGGYLLGFLAAAPAAAGVRRWLRSSPRLAADIAAAVTCLSLVYALGTLQLILVSAMSAGTALIAGVAPFVLPDLLKVAGAVVTAEALRRVLYPVSA